ncbi:neural cell adhesion molecule L1 [Elysia marginata]|uniref:Neural cell adhesion molecule L1 n=1 Tax=Elysia marginata TaxID=1093978 RepID=A0AAV4IW38_9GAST|nr:neural cell adhesion molecule L1 [Elysia marginata]
MTSGQLVRVAACVALLLFMLDLNLAQDTSQVRKPPVILKPTKQQTEYITNGNAYKLECKASGEPKPTYQWKKDGQILSSNAEITVVSKNGDLIINKFLPSSHEGEYMCIATNAYDGPDGLRRTATSMAPPIRILELVAEAFTNDSTVARVGVEFEYLKFECRDQGKIQVPILFYNWYSSSKSDQIKLDKRLYIDTDGSLHFTYLKTEDEVPKTYRCGATNGKTAIALGSATSLKVNTASSSGASDPIFQYSNTGVQAKLFSAAILECFFSGYDPASADKVPTVKWFDDAGSEITAKSNPTKYGVSDDGRRLTINNVQETDEKNYYCQGITTSKKTEPEAVRLDVVSAPIFLKENGAPIDLTLPEQSNAVFHCSTRSLTGEQKPDPPKWYINGSPSGTHNSPDKYQWSADKKTLTIMKLSKLQDIQCVQCKVSNNYGSTWGDACLNVILRIKVTNDPSLRQEIKKGDIVNLTVIATTDPSEQLTYSWEFNNQTYDLRPPHVTYNKDTKEAFINTSLLTQQEYETIGGVYTRIIKHVHETLPVEMEVVLKDGPIVGPVVSKGGVDMWIIGLIIGILFLIIVIIIIIFVVCRKKQEGDYNVDKKETGAGLDPEKELKEKGFDDYSRP